MKSAVGNELGVICVFGQTILFTLRGSVLTAAGAAMAAEPWPIQLKSSFANAFKQGLAGSTPFFLGENCRISGEQAMMIVARPVLVSPRAQPAEAPAPIV